MKIKYIEGYYEVAKTGVYGTKYAKHVPSWLPLNFTDVIFDTSEEDYEATMKELQENIKARQAADYEYRYGRRMDRLNTYIRRTNRRAS